MRHELIPLQNPAGWRQALRGIPHAFGHTWEACQAFNLTTDRPTFLYHFQSDHMQVVCPLAERRFRDGVDVVTPFGFSGFAKVGSSAAFATAWLDFARRRGWVCGYFLLNPLLDSSGCFEPADIRDHRELFVLDLTVPPDELFQRMSRSHRREIRSFEASEAKVIDDREALTDFIVRESPGFFRERRASPVYFFTERTWRELLSLPLVDVLGVVVGDRVVAATVYATTGHICDQLFHISIPAGRSHAALLTWEGVLRMQARNVEVMNLGGGVHRGDGIARFKKKYRAEIVPLRAVKQVYNQQHYFNLCREAGADPFDNYFPAYQNPRL